MSGQNVVLTASLGQLVQAQKAVAQATEEIQQAVAAHPPPDGTFQQQVLASINGIRDELREHKQGMQQGFQELKTDIRSMSNSVARLNNKGAAPNQLLHWLRNEEGAEPTHPRVTLQSALALRAPQLTTLLEHYGLGQSAQGLNVHAKCCLLLTHLGAWAQPVRDPVDTIEQCTLSHLQVAGKVRPSGWQPCLYHVTCRLPGACGQSAMQLLVVSGTCSNDIPPVTRDSLLPCIVVEHCWSTHSPTTTAFAEPALKLDHLGADTERYSACGGCHVLGFGQYASCLRSPHSPPVLSGERSASQTGVSAPSAALLLPPWLLMSVRHHLHSAGCGRLWARGHCGHSPAADCNWISL
ncbi:hypothetical protein HaLaN_25589 [Haematococcus lacustris]|uniref:Uncharacterized protein n=1 Tax=Haematococcus lacustris TaxID=44745 RepID=A0A6A0A534_HAELA|nr:hypothetical protein HaLaN_25589 [Haematococcus lacustris]